MPKKTETPKASWITYEVISDKTTKAVTLGSIPYTQDTKQKAIEQAESSIAEFKPPSSHVQGKKFRAIIKSGDEVIKEVVIDLEKKDEEPLPDAGV